MKSNRTDFSVIPLKNGSKSCTATDANNKPMNDSNNDSKVKCVISPERFAPIIFRTLISRLRVADWAVARFMKLMHAIIKMMIATILNNLSCSMRPPTALPLSNSL